ncbi:hypothetical protein J437_LFUL010501, partial [Ladona fulva]
QNRLFLNLSSASTILSYAFKSSIESETSAARSCIFCSAFSNSSLVLYRPELKLSSISETEAIISELSGTLSMMIQMAEAIYLSLGVGKRNTMEPPLFY